MQAAEPEMAKWLYEYFNEQLRGFGLTVQTGEFGAMMQVELVNDETGHNSVRQHTYILNIRR